MRTQTTTGFMDALGNHLASVASLSLTKGTNLFAEVHFDDPDKLTDQLVLFDDGYESLPEKSFMYLKWRVRLSTARKGRNGSIEALRPYVNELVNGKRFTATSDASENFLILRAVVVTAPDSVDKLGSGRYLAEATIELDVIPK